MNGFFDNNYTSIWAWKPKEVAVSADPKVRHGTIIGYIPDPLLLPIPNCLLHRSWHPDTIQAKIDRYNKLGLPMHHPTTFAGVPEPLPDWARN